MKIKTNELTGAALDWAVAEASGATYSFDGATADDCFLEFPTTAMSLPSYNPSTDWAQGGPIIGWEALSLIRRPDGQWTSDNFSILTRSQQLNFGPTPLIAAMRCFCCAKLGDEIDIPEELCQSQNS